MVVDDDPNFRHLLASIVRREGYGVTVNTAKRIETYGAPGRIHVSAVTREILGGACRFEPRGALELKGKGPIETFFLERPG